MEFMDELSSMMMVVMIKDMMLFTMLGMSFVTPFTPKIPMFKHTNKVHNMFVFHHYK
jgi:hypothetical protein